MDDKDSELRSDPSFARYQEIWQKNEGSFVFVPLAEIYRKKGLLEEAADVCRRGLKHNPSSVAGRYLLARIYVDQGKKEEAQHLLRDILHDNPEHTEAQVLMQGLQEEPPPVVAKPARAPARVSPSEVWEEEPEEVTEKAQPKKLWATVTMAEIYANQKEWQAARDICHAILQRDPDNARAKELLNRCDSSTEEVH